MSYTTDDFSESLNRVALDRDEIEVVVAAWGKGEGMGEDAPHYRWAETSATDWAGGFLIRRKDGRHIYLTGWCDYIGWGCHDGAQLYEFAAEPSIADLKRSSEYHNEPDESEWDREPADLNRWLKAQPVQS